MSGRSGRLVAILEITETTERDNRGAVLVIARLDCGHEVLRRFPRSRAAKCGICGTQPVAGRRVDE